MKINKALLLSPILAAFGVMFATSQAQGPVEVSYWLWDSNQEPAYKKCAENFGKTNPGIKVNVQQKGWDDYWTGINTGMVAGTAPDIFTNHLAKYPEYANNKQIVDVSGWIKEDKVPTDAYTGELYKLWGREGRQYGLPKDWDTVAIIYNKAMLKAAGISEASLGNLKWNAKDGGTFEKTIAKLTIDENGNRGGTANFDKASKIKQYGWVSLPGNSAGGAYGQTEWSHFAVSNGFKFNDGPWTTKYNYDDPKLAESLQWQADISLKKGYAPLYKDTRANQGNSVFTAGKAALIFDGSWTIGSYKSNSKFEVGFAQLPVGPAGRKTMFNGLADSIWTGSKKQKEAWQWLKYMGSAACQDVVGDFGVVFPAIPSAVGKALKSFKGKGVDVSAFTKQALAKNTTFLFPITDNAAQIGDVMTVALDKIFLGQAQAADILKEANDKVNATFK
jgi:multiple sugar transport system substrate-binding protein